MGCHVSLCLCVMSHLKRCDVRTTPARKEAGVVVMVRVHARAAGGQVPPTMRPVRIGRTHAGPHADTKLGTQQPNNATQPSPSNARRPTHSGTPRMPFLLTTAQNVMSLARAENGAPAVRSDVHIEYTHRTVVATVTMVAGGRRKGGGGKPPEAVIGVVAGSNLYPGNLYIKFVFHSPPRPGGPGAQYHAPTTSLVVPIVCSV